MRLELLDYQTEAAFDLLQRLRRAKDDWEHHQSLSAFALSAVTGAGKTVVATAVIEALLHGSAELGVDADPRATFLWVTDDPALNRQTRNKMLLASDVLAPNRLLVLGNGYLDRELRPGRVYFLNIQQLSRSAGFAHGGRNLRQHSGWDVIGNTIRAEDRDLYLVLDEAHRGMRPARDRGSIVQRIIGGQPGANPPAPVVWGISATIERFTTAMQAHETVRTTYPAVNVDIDKVRASGIVKDRIEIDEPDESGTFSATLLRAAVDRALDFDQRWAEYAVAENEPVVLPVLVVQVADRASAAHLAELVSIIEQQWPSLGPGSIVNVFGEHDDLMIGGRTVRWVSPESVQDDEQIRVVLAKEAISTGWDCPRAEVMYSERPARDATHIAQVIGRMVRSPLARRITTDDSLNSVSCFLPLFNRSALGGVIRELTRPGEPGSASEIVVNAQNFPRNQMLAEEVSSFVEDVPSWPKPDRLASPLRRARTLAKLLTDASSGDALLPDAGEQLTLYLNRTLDGLAARHADAVDAGMRDLESLDTRTVTIGALDGEIVETQRRSIRTAARDIDRDTRRVVNSIKEGVGTAFVRHLVGNAPPDTDTLQLRVQAAALFLVDGVADEIDNAATAWVQEQFSSFAVDIRNTTGAAKDAYMKVKEQTSEQEQTGIELTGSQRTATKMSNEPDADDLPRFSGHLFSDADGMFPAKLNQWETTVLETELGRSSFVAWYRNPSRAGTDAQRVGYLTDSESWGSLQVDFLVISRRDDGTLAVSIVDPHGDHLADAKSKLRGLARFAEQFGGSFIRIESIAKTSGGTLRSLDLLDPDVRGAVDAFEGGRVTALYESAAANDYR